MQVKRITREAEGLFRSPRYDGIVLQALMDYDACMKSVQYTIRGVPERLDARLRERAAREGRSLNGTVLQVLKAGLGIGEEQIRFDDLDDLAGTWVHDPEFDKALEEMHQIDPDLWK